MAVIEQPSEGAISWNHAQLDETTGGFSITGGINSGLPMCHRSGAPDDARVLEYNSAIPRTCSNPLTEGSPLPPLPPPTPSPTLPPTPPPPGPYPNSLC